MSSQFRLYIDGNVQFIDDRVEQAVSFAHVTDLHLSDPRKDRCPRRYQQAIEWWNKDMGQPDQSLAALLDEVRDAKVDFVLFGGDNIDYYDPHLADHLVELCDDRGIKAHFILGNHDFESLEQRFITHEIDAETRSVNGEKLRQHWGMSHLYDSFDIRGVRFIALDMIYQRTADDNLAAFIDEEQTHWFLEQADFEGPIFIFCHYPFNCPTLEHRLRAIWNGKLACAAEDVNGMRVLEAIKNNPNIMATLVGHAHISSEDPIGQSWQFLTAGAHTRQWRHVRIHNGEPPKSLHVPGVPIVAIGE